MQLIALPTECRYFDPNHEHKHYLLSSTFPKHLILQCERWTRECNGLKTQPKNRQRDMHVCLTGNDL